MNLSASVQFRDAPAHYTLVAEAEGVYLAQLQSYEGKPENTPPETIMLTRGIRRWIGSVDNREVLEALGHVLERTNFGDPSSSSGVRVVRPAPGERKPADEV